MNRQNVNKRQHGCRQPNIRYFIIKSPLSLTAAWENSDTHCSAQGERVPVLEREGTGKSASVRI